MGIRPARLAVLVLGLAWGVGLACNVEHKGAARKAAPAASGKILTPLWVGPAFSGSWYNPARSGEGFTLQILDNGSALAVWFTYPPAGSPARQAWILAQDGVIEGDRIRFGTVFTTRGPRFGAQYDPAQLQILPWGSLEFRFTGCNSGEFTYSGPAAWGSGTRALTRLTALSELECAGKRRLTTSGARALSGLRQRSGALYDPAHNGEGWQFEELPDGRAQVYWFTYDENGEQAWTIGTSEVSGDRVVVSQNLQPAGARFGAAFDPAQVQLVPWGSYTIDFAGCDRGTVTYQSGLSAFGSGTLRPIRLTKLAGNACVEGTPTVPAGGTWSQGATMPIPQSEFALASLDTRACTAGGLGTPQEFQCYDVVTGAWTRGAALPGARDHGLALTLGGELIVTGGYRSSSQGEQGVSGWRYRAAEDRWEALPQLPDVAASGAALLDGYAWFGNVTGEVRQVDPRTFAQRVLPRGDALGRDHAQLVAFQGELWLIGGRDPAGIDHERVSIFDPASETWRDGPPLLGSRAGFAAVATPTAIFVAGGEKLVVPRTVLGSVEAIAAGEAAWTSAGRLPVPVHGVGAVVHGNAMYVLGGSRQAGIARNEGQVQVYRWAP